MLVYNEIGASIAIFHEMSDILIICVESDKILSLHKLYKHLPAGFLIDIANNTIQVGGLFLVYGIVVT